MSPTAEGPSSEPEPLSQCIIIHKRWVCSVQATLDCPRPKAQSDGADDGSARRCRHGGDKMLPAQAFVQSQKSKKGMCLSIRTRRLIPFDFWLRRQHGQVVEQGQGPKAAREGGEEAGAATGFEDRACPLRWRVSASSLRDLAPPRAKMVFWLLRAYACHLLVCLQRC